MRLLSNVSAAFLLVQPYAAASAEAAAAEDRIAAPGVVAACAPLQSSNTSRSGLAVFSGAAIVALMCSAGDAVAPAFAPKAFGSSAVAAAKRNSQVHDHMQRSERDSWRLLHC